MVITNIHKEFGAYLYSRLPEAYREFDTEIEREDKIYYTLQEYLYGLAEGGFEPLMEDLECMIYLVDPMKVPTQFLPLILHHFGLDYIEDIPERFQRRLLQNIVTLYKKKGTLPCIAFLARELSGFDVRIEETDRGGITFTLIYMDAYEDEDAELLLTQDIIQRYIHLFLPPRVKAEIIVVYGFTEGVHLNSLRDYNNRELNYKYKIDDSDYMEIDEGLFEERHPILTRTIEKCLDTVYWTDGAFDEGYSFMPFDTTSVTNYLDPDSEFVFTNGMTAIDKIISADYKGTGGVVAFNAPTEAEIAGLRIVANHDEYIPLTAHLLTDLKAGQVIKCISDGEELGSYLVPCDLYGIGKDLIHVLYNPIDETLKLMAPGGYFDVSPSLTFTKTPGYPSFTFELPDVWIDLIDENNRTVYGATYAETMAYYGGVNRETYVGIFNGYGCISKNGIYTVDELIEYLKDNPVRIVSKALWGQFPYMELRKTDKEADLSVTVLPATTEYDGSFSYPHFSLMQNPVVTVEDGNGNKTDYELPLDLLSLDDAHDRLEKVDGDYYIVHMVEKLPLNEITEMHSVGAVDIISIPLDGELTGNVNDKVYINCYGHCGGYLKMGESEDSFYGKQTYEAYQEDGALYVHIFNNNIFTLENTLRILDWSDIEPCLFYCRPNPRREKITDKNVINKLNLLPIPEKYAKIYSRDIPFAELSVSVKNSIFI